MIIHGDCLEILRSIPDNSVDSIVTDPPYGLSFMNKHWDYDVPKVDVWSECLRVLKPGGHALIACGTRTQHRMAVNIEDAGFEIRDVITWLYGSGFPKSLDVSKAIDKAAGAEREKLGPKSTYRKPQEPNGWDCTKRAEFETAPSTEAAKQWAGWGTALKPACEFWTLARKPFKGTVAENVQAHGTGALNIDGCRVEYSSEADKASATPQGIVTSKKPSDGYAKAAGVSTERHRIERPLQMGRFPANLILDEEAAALLDAQTGVLRNGGQNGTSRKGAGMFMEGSTEAGTSGFAGDSGGASRFFYVAKASKSERGEGNVHPTVKPIKLMAYLCRLITPPGGIVLDPFMGSGSTGVAAKAEGFDFIGIEREAEYLKIAECRLVSGIP